jgi:hypothetical protein
MADQELVIFEELKFEDIEPTAMEADVGTALEGFGDEELAFAQEMEACWSLGPLRACASVVGGGEVRVSASLLGRTILSSTLSTRRTRICASPNVGLAKAELCIALDISGRQVRVEGRFCVRRITGSWRCTSFNSRLLSW